MQLFEKDASENVKQLDALVAGYAGFDSCYKVTGQTYSRKVDVEVINALGSLGSTAHKICTDIR